MSGLCYLIARDKFGVVLRQALVSGVLCTGLSQCWCALVNVR